MSTLAAIAIMLVSLLLCPTLLSLSSEAIAASSVGPSCSACALDDAEDDEARFLGLACFVFTVVVAADVLVEGDVFVDDAADDDNDEEDEGDVTAITASAVIDILPLGRLSVLLFSNPP